MLNTLPINLEKLLQLGFAVIDLRWYPYPGESSIKYVIKRVNVADTDFYTTMINDLSNKEIRTADAYSTWEQILIQKLKLSHILKRDIDITVAVWDYTDITNNYCSNVNQER